MGAMIGISLEVSRFRLSQDLAARPHASFGIGDCKNHTKTVLDRMELASFRFQARQKTAKALGLTFPESFLLRADEVIKSQCSLLQRKSPQMAHCGGSRHRNIMAAIEAEADRRRTSPEGSVG